MSAHKNLYHSDKRSLPITRAIAKYGESLLLDILYMTKTLEEALELEEQYRPTDHTGWNVCNGGVAPNSEYLRTAWNDPIQGKILYEKIHTPESKVKKSIAATRRYQDEEERTRMSKLAVKRWKRDGPWTMGKANKQLWSCADIIYSLWESNSWSFYKIEKYLGLERMSCYSIVKKFQSGWIPQKDSRWVDYYRQEHEVFGGIDNFG